MNSNIELKAFLSSRECRSSHSLTFMNWIKKMASILDNSDDITFYLRTGVPLKTTISFKKLGHTSMVSYLAPRIDEIEFDEDDDFEDF